MAWNRAPWFASAHFASPWFNAVSETPVPPEITPIYGGGYRLYYPPSNRARILRDDEEILLLLFSFIQSTSIH